MASMTCPTSAGASSNAAIVRDDVGDKRQLLVKLITDPALPAGTQAVFVIDPTVMDTI